MTARVVKVITVIVALVTGGCVGASQERGTIPSPGKAGVSSDLYEGMPPPELRDLQEIGPGVAPVGGGLPEIRQGALRDAAIAYGAQGGLARRSWEINRDLKDRDRDLSGIYAFRLLVIPIDGGGVIVPPVISEAEDALAVSPDGQAASSSARVFHIIRPARIATGAVDWRSYLLRAWQPPREPDALLRPRNDKEREAWRVWVVEGWRTGVAQADDIFRADVDRLARDFQGMVRYRKLVAQGVVKELHLAQADLGVTGGGDELRVGERVVRIARPARLDGESGEWAPIVVR